MSIKDIFSELREDRKQRKLEKKNKKKKLTRDQKNHKIFGILLGFFVLFGCFFTACSKMSCSGEFAWNDLVGISDETISELQEYCDESEIVFENRINQNDWLECIEILKKSGVDVFNGDDIDEEKLKENTFSPIDFTLNGSQIGALYNNLLYIYNYSSQFEVVNFKINGNLNSNRKGVLDSVVFINLTEILGVENLPSVYVKSNSNIEILDEKLVTLDTEIQINKLSETAMNEILEFLEKTSLNSISNMGNDMVNSCIGVFAESLGMKIKIVNNGVQFYK